MDPAVVREIGARLSEIEKAESVSIPLAVESGSRAWGFPSPDSDYDCRFVYVRSLEDAADLFPARDVIETPLTPVFDVNGWDLGKALKLMLKGNAVILEWLQSPIFYRRDQRFCDDFMALAKEVFQREVVGWHYMQLLRRQIDRTIKSSEPVTVKKIFYALRPAMALRFMRLQPAAELVPMNFHDLCAECRLEAEVQDAIAALLELKTTTLEAGVAEAPPQLMVFAQSELERAGGWVAPVSKQRGGGRDRARQLYIDMMHRFNPDRRR